MQIKEYQEAALVSDKPPKAEGSSVFVALLGLSGEVGELLSEYKNHIWKGGDHQFPKERVTEELGDLLWYLANTASKFGLDLDDIALRNLKKCRDRWTQSDPVAQLGFPISVNRYDQGYPELERLPRLMTVTITDLTTEGKPKIELTINGQRAGDNLTDNSHVTDGYRFHDVFHLSYAAVLGWSPVLRGNLKCKRKSDSRMDEVEDGGRAIVIEEGISALVFSYASKNSFLKGVDRLDYELLRTIKGMTSGLEVSRCPMADWEKAIFTGYAIWRKIVANKGGTFVANLDAQSLTFSD